MCIYHKRLWQYCRCKEINKANDSISTLYIKAHIKGKYDMDLASVCKSFSVSNLLTRTLCL